MMNVESSERAHSPTDRAPIHHSSFRLPHSSRAFTLVELLAVLMIVVLLAATFVPYAMSLREANNRARCTDNLRGIAEALSIYARNNSFAYPRTRFDAALGNGWTAFTGADEVNPFAVGSAVAANDVSASLWLLVREELAQPFRFVCPSSEGSPDLLRDAAGKPTTGRQRGNFRSAEHLTYAVASPFSAVADYAFNDTLPSGFVLVADQGPSIEMLGAGRVPAADARPQALAMGNSVNHRRAGQNVLYASGTVQFETTPYSGVGRRPAEAARPGVPAKPAVPGDNIYTALALAPLVETRPDHASPGYAGVTVGPSYRYDTYLVPGADVEASLVAPAATATSAPVVPPSTTRAAEPPTPPAATRAVAPPATTRAAITAPSTAAASRPASTTTPVP